MDYQKSTVSKIVRISLVLILFAFIGVANAATFGVQPVSVTAVVPNASIPPSNNSGGGSGGGNASAPSSGETLSQSAIFKGIAYPGSIVTLFKNGSIVAEQPTSPDATFEISISGLRSGTYLFSLRAQDNSGRHSTLNTYTIHVTSGVTTLVKGIFIAPTVAIDKKEVRRGDPLVVIGKSLQNAEVTLIFNSEREIVKKTTVDTSGNWLYKLDTLELEYGDHQVKARASTVTDIAPFSQSLSFIVGQQSVVKDTQSTFAIYDVSHDGKVNLVDFSILAYWYRRAKPPVAVDINADGVVNLVDFSLLIYHWTG